MRRTLADGIFVEGRDYVGRDPDQRRRTLGKRIWRLDQQAAPVERVRGGEKPPRSRGWLPPVARAAAWVTVALYVAGIVTTYALERATGLGEHNLTEDAVIIAGFGVVAAVGALLVARRPSNLVGWILVACALMVGLFPAGDAYAAYVMTTRGQPDPLAVVGAWVQSWYWYLLLALLLIYLPLLFPDGRLPSRRFLPVALLVGIGTVGLIILGMLTGTLSGQDVDYRIANPIGVEGLSAVEDLPIFDVLGGLVYFVGALGAFVAVVVRFRRSRGVERQQMKWFLYAAAPLLTLPLEDFLPQFVNQIETAWVFIGLPAAIGVAVHRYRLYDIDVVINRTLVYGALTLSLALVYVGSVVALQYVFRALASENSQLVIVASTLLIAALFNPLRRRLQNFIDRLFYRDRYDAKETLEAFSNRLRDEVDVDDLGGDLISVVRDTVRPAHAALWLRDLDGTGTRAPYSHSEPEAGR